MPDYLEREKVLDDSNIITVQTREYGNIEVIPVDYISNLPTVNKVIERGEWVIRTSTHDSFKCSRCGNNHERQTPYCPNCGKYMFKERIK